MSWSKWFSESFYQFVDQDITTARTTHSQDRDYILSCLLVILSWEIAWPVIHSSVHNFNVVRAMRRIRKEGALTNG